MENISLNVSWIFKPHDIKKVQVQDKKYLKFLSKHFAENGKEKPLPNNSSNGSLCTTNTILTI